MLHVYAELVASGAPAEQRYPGIAPHLQACGRVEETSRGCWPRSATKRNNRTTLRPRHRQGDRRPYHSAPAPPDRGYFSCVR
jgi:hypothetical protein